MGALAMGVVIAGAIDLLSGALVEASLVATTTLLAVAFARSALGPIATDLRRSRSGCRSGARMLRRWYRYGLAAAYVLCSGAMITIGLIVYLL
jgi:hypothetical protein